MAADYQIIPLNISGSNITVKPGACVGKMLTFIRIYIRILPSTASKQASKANWKVGKGSALTLTQSNRGTK